MDNKPISDAEIAELKKAVAAWGGSPWPFAIEIGKLKRLIAAYDEYDRLRAAQAGLQPIETAPRDGTQIDVWCRGQFRSGRVTQCWFAMEKLWRYAEGDDDEDGFCRAQVHNATHWMPLPEPPK